MKEKHATRRWSMRFTGQVAGVIAICVVLGYGGVSLFLAERLTRPTNRPPWFDARQLECEARPWSARTRDGVMLRGWHLPSEKGRHLIALVHGMWSSWGEMAALGRDLHSRGFDVLLFDLRGHGQSGPSRLYLGRRERFDICAVLSWAESQGFTQDRVGWLGYSMGASTLLLEGARNPGIHVAVVDSAYGDLPKVLRRELSKHSGLPSWFNPGILLAARLVYGVRTDDLVPIHHARAWGDRPLLVIHGEADSIVPVTQAKELAAAVGNSCMTLTLPGVDHVQAYDSDPARYVDLVGGFFDEHLAP
jgi:alpha-beta hydrolase superfamily lysophospholipase